MKNKKILVLCVWMIMSIFMAACTGTSNQSASGTSGVKDSGDSISLSQVNELLVGTLKLEETDQTVTTDQAAQLLPLWQAYRSLSTSQTSAQAEVEALLNQIQSTMTPEQVQAIKTMNLTNTDMVDLMQSMGGGMVRGTPNPEGTPSVDIFAGGFEGGVPPSGDFQIGSGGGPGGTQGGATRAFPSGGVVIMGGGPGGDAGSVIMGEGPMLQGTPDPSMQATAQARFGTMAKRVNTILLDILISNLEAKITS